MKREKTTPTVGSELVRRLNRFVDKLEATDDLRESFTCRTVKLNVKPQRYTPKLVKKTRFSMRASQAIFAQFLGVSPSTVRDWEQGLKPPNGAACRLMDEIRHKPEYFLGRLKELCTAAGR